MSNANRLVLWLLGALLLGGVLWYGYWFATHFERQSREERTDISPEARKNRFLAAELLLQRLGREVTSHGGRDIFSLNPAEGDTLFIGRHSQLFLERNGLELIEWVRGGGELIIALDPHYADEEELPPLLAQLGVELRMGDGDEESAGACTPEEGEPFAVDGDGSESLPDSDGDMGGETAGEPDENGEDEIEEGNDEGRWVTVTFSSDQPGQFSANFLAERYLEDNEGQATIALGHEGRAKLLRIPLERGRVTLLSDSELFSNDHIGELDHAYLFTQLIRDTGRVWIFYSADIPSLAALLWRKAPYLTVLFTLLLLLAGWRMLRNSGPLLRQPFTTRRNLLEHLDATAEYSWRTDRARHLFLANRQALEQAWRRRHPQLHQLDQEERCAWIGERCGLNAAAVERTLYGEIEREHDFIRASAVMQRLAMRINHPGEAGPTG